MTGEATADVYEVDSIEVDGARVGGMTVFGHDSGDLASDGLLGRDFLNHFSVTIDNSAGRATLRRKPMPEAAVLPPRDVEAQRRNSARGSLTYLMQPPVGRPTAPHANWLHAGSFDTAASCEEARRTAQLTAEATWRRNLEHAQSAVVAFLLVTSESEPDAGELNKYRQWLANARTLGDVRFWINREGSPRKQGDTMQDELRTASGFAVLSMITARVLYDQELRARCVSSR